MSDPTATDAEVTDATVPDATTLAEAVGVPAPARVGRLAGALVIGVDLATALGVVVGLNQLATQSPVDAILPVALFSVGLAGVLALAAALAGLAGRTGGDAVGSGPAHPLAPPSVESGAASFALGVAGVAAVAWRWGVAAQAAVVGVQGLRLLIDVEAAAVASLRRAPGRPDAYRLGLTAAEAVLLLVFAVAALADGGVRPFT